MREVDDPEWATPMTPPCEFDPGVQLPQTWIQITPPALAVAAKPSDAETTMSAAHTADRLRARTLGLRAPSFIASQQMTATLIGAAMDAPAL